MRSKAPSGPSSKSAHAAEDIVLRYYRLVDARDFNGMAELFSVDVIYRRPGYETMVGLEQMLNYYKLVRVIESGKHDIRTVLSDGIQVAVTGTFYGTVKDCGDVSQDFADFFSVSDGRISARSTYFDSPAI